MKLRSSPTLCGNHLHLAEPDYSCGTQNNCMFAGCVIRNKTFMPTKFLFTDICITADSTCPLDSSDVKFRLHWFLRILWLRIAGLIDFASYFQCNEHELWWASNIRPFDWKNWMQADQHIDIRSCSSQPSKHPHLSAPLCSSFRLWFWLDSRKSI